MNRKCDQNGFSAAGFSFSDRLLTQAGKMNKSIKHNLPQSDISEKHFRGMIESTTGIPWIVDFVTFQFYLCRSAGGKDTRLPCGAVVRNRFLEYTHPSR